jgi:hypothetical protein
MQISIAQAESTIAKVPYRPKWRYDIIVLRLSRDRQFDIAFVVISLCFEIAP